MAAIFESNTRDHWTNLFADRDACVTPVLTLTEAAAAPELRERETYVDWDGLVQPAPAPRLSASPSLQRPRSRWSSHTDEILAELGLDESSIVGLREDAVIA